MDNLEPVKPRPRNSLPVIILAGAVLIVIFIVGLRSGLGPVAAVDGEVPFQTVERLTLNQAYVAFLSESAVFVDVRTEAAYAGGHIPRAASMPAAVLERRFTQLDPEAWVIVYGEAIDEADSAAAAEFLLKQGLEHVSVLFGGIDAWSAAGHPVDP